MSGQEQASNYFDNKFKNFGKNLDDLRFNAANALIQISSNWQPLMLTLGVLVIMMAVFLLTDIGNISVLRSVGVGAIVAFVLGVQLGLCYKNWSAAAYIWAILSPAVLGVVLFYAKKP
jgi:hypothetical protein